MKQDLPVPFLDEEFFNTLWKKLNFSRFARSRNSVFKSSNELYSQVNKVNKSNATLKYPFRVQKDFLHEYARKLFSIECIKNTTTQK